MKEQKKTEQTHPTWTDVLPIALSVIGDQEATQAEQDAAVALLTRMAQTADQWNSPE